MTRSVERAVEAAVERTAARVAARLGDVSGVAVTVAEGDVTVRGRALLRRLVEEPALGRWGGVR